MRNGWRVRGSLTPVRLGPARPYFLDRWESLVRHGDVLGLHRVLTGLDRDSVEMCEVSPTGGLLPQDERQARTPGGGLMRRDQLEPAIRTACQIIGSHEVIVVGSQSILGSFREDQLPADAGTSRHPRRRG
jgi:hypothetical protein